AKIVIAKYQESDGGPLELILGLLFAWTFIRASAYVLGHVVPEGTLQRKVIRAVTWGAWIAVILHFTGLLPDVLAQLDAHSVTYGKNNTEITLLDVTQGVAALFFAVIFALWLSRVTETRVMAADSVELTTRVVIVKVMKISVLVVAIFIALP